LKPNLSLIRHKDEFYKVETLDVLKEIACRLKVNDKF